MKTCGRVRAEGGGLVARNGCEKLSFLVVIPRTKASSIQETADGTSGPYHTSDSFLTIEKLSLVSIFFLLCHLLKMLFCNVFVTESSLSCFQDPRRPLLSLSSRNMLSVSVSANRLTVCFPSNGDYIISPLWYSPHVLSSSVQTGSWVFLFWDLGITYFVAHTVKAAYLKIPWPGFWLWARWNAYLSALLWNAYLSALLFTWKHSYGKNGVAAPRCFHVRGLSWEVGEEIPCRMSVSGTQALWRRTGVRER